MVKIFLCVFRRLGLFSFFLNLAGNNFRFVGNRKNVGLKSSAKILVKNFFLQTMHCVIQSHRPWLNTPTENSEKSVPEGM